MRNVVLSHEEDCPSRNGEAVRVKLFLRELDMEEQIQRKRESRRRDYTPPRFLKERYECPHSADCPAVREDGNACPVYQSFHVPGCVE